MSREAIGMLTTVLIAIPLIAIGFWGSTGFADDSAETSSETIRTADQHGYKFVEGKRKSIVDDIHLTKKEDTASTLPEETYEIPTVDNDDSEKDLFVVMPPVTNEIEESLKQQNQRTHQGRHRSLTGETQADFEHNELSTEQSNVDLTGQGDTEKIETTDPENDENKKNDEEDQDAPGQDGDHFDEESRDDDNNDEDNDG